MRNPLLCRKVSAPLGEGRLDALSALAVESLEWDNRTSDPETAYTQARYKLRELAKSLDNLLPPVRRPQAAARGHDGQI